MLKAILGCIGLFALTALNVAAAQQDVSISVITSFDYPNTYTATFPDEINNRGDIAGYFIDTDGLEKGFVLFANGTFTPPIVPPFDIGDYTGASGINDARTITGFFVGSDNITTHAYFYSRGVFTQFDIEGAAYTSVASLNDIGDFTGSFGNLSTSILGYLDTGGQVIPFSVEGSSFTFATAINGLDEIAGEYRTDAAGTNHGFLRDRLGNMMYPIDFPGTLGPLGTFLSAMNDRGWVVGRYYDTNSVDHGFVFKRPNTFISFDYPESISTRVTGINNKGIICGEYQDNIAAARHGFVARIH